MISFRRFASVWMNCRPPVDLDRLLELVTAAGVELPDEGRAGQGVLLSVLLPLDLELSPVLG